MASQAHCAFCFEVLSATFERRTPLSLAETEELWEQYHESDKDAQNGEEDADMTDAEGDEPQSTNARPAAISRLLNRETSAGNSSSSLQSTSTASSSDSRQTDTETPASSTTSLRSAVSHKREGTHDEYPLFVTWNTVSRSGNKSLRGCIGTFEAQKLEYGLKSYALTSAFDDTRFSPIPASLMPQLSAHVTLLTNFSHPVKDPLDWTLGIHGIRIAFTYHGRRYGATYLPDVANEQGWTKDETLVSLMRKAGWNGSSRDWQKVWRDGKGELVRYEGRQVGLGYEEWKEWRDWVESREGRLRSLK